jgi:hypothetical protein
MSFIDKVHCHVTHETSFVVEKKLKAAVPQFELNSAESLRAVQDTLIFEVMNSASCAQFECPQPRKGSQSLCDVAPTELWNYVDKFVALYGKFRLDVKLRQGVGKVPVTVQTIPIESTLTANADYDTPEPTQREYHEYSPPEIILPYFDSRGDLPGGDRWTDSNLSVVGQSFMGPAPTNPRTLNFEIDPGISWESHSRTGLSPESGIDDYHSG